MTGNDTGSDVDVIGHHVLQKAGISPDSLAKPIESIHTADGRAMDVAGTIPISLSLGDKLVKRNVHIIRDVSDALLSEQSLVALGFLPPGWPFHENGHSEKFRRFMQLEGLMLAMTRWSEWGPGSRESPSCTSVPSLMP